MSTTVNDGGLEASKKDEDRLYRRVAWRILPLLLIGYVIAFLDRVNIGFAKLHMLDELAFSEAVFGLGAGLFFAGYLLFEVPSNLILHRVGARLWLARIMLSWCAVCVLTAFVTQPWQFYTLRFLLGVAEAGFYPGVILYLTYWFPEHRRASKITIFQTGIPLAGIAGAPLSGWIMDHFHQWYGMSGWQWLLVLEALPAIPVAIAFILLLDNRIMDAKWLSAEEKQLLQSRIQTESQAKHIQGVGDALRNSGVWKSCLVGILLSMGVYGISFYLPTIIKRAGAESATSIGLLTAIPYLAVAVGLVALGVSAGRLREHRWHAAGAALVGSAALCASMLFVDRSLPMTLAMLSLAAAGIMSALPLGWNLFCASVSGRGAAAAIGLITSVGGIGGLIGPYIIGAVAEASQRIDTGIYIVGAAGVLGAVLLLTYPISGGSRRTHENQ
ncbi:MFS transporter [Pusillimonas sp.]|uniref:MFS transporter n=1 Tax=Pusillimonas sp. TaxID=3040095 RepID=UPI0029B6D1E4|nr:MFS transporter [Pusillimonas sp.]MDX3895014.1 MFS transporter [Pusillimonas sp.]